MYIQNDEVIYFDSFGFEHTPKKIKKCKDDQNIIEKYFSL